MFLYVISQDFLEYELHPFYVGFVMSSYTVYDKFEIFLTPHPPQLILKEKGKVKGVFENLFPPFFSSISFVSKRGRN